MTAAASMVYGLASYVVFLMTFLYAVGFVANMPMLPKTIDYGGEVADSWVTSALVDGALLGLFALQHSVMARPGFKRWWTRFVPHRVERSTYVLLASAALILLYWQWEPLPLPVWTFTSAPATIALHLLAAMGWALVLLSTFAISHFELFGLKQVYAGLRNAIAAPPEFRTPTLYRMVRHPIYLGFILAFWGTPGMTVGHLLFAAMATAYILVGIQLEERDLIAVFGDRYRRYRAQVPMLLPLSKPQAAAEPHGGTGLTP